MANQEIIVEIGLDGKISVEAKGYQGVGCKAATEFIENMGTIIKAEDKPELRQRPKKQKKQIKKGRG